MMASLNLDADMEGLFGDSDQTQETPDTGTQSLTQEEAEQEGGAANLDVTGTGEVKKKINRNPQPKLDADRLMGARGLQTLEEVFKDWQPRGKGREFDDLDVVMKKMEHWCHRLYPSLPYDQVLEKIANLGKKKTVSTHVKKIRLGMVINAPRNEGGGEEQQDEDEVARYAEEEPQRDEFEEMMREAGDEEMAPPPPPPPARAAPTRVGMTEEQKERVRKNREMAERRRRERLAAAAAADLTTGNEEDQATVIEGVEKVSLDRNSASDRCSDENTSRDTNKDAEDHQIDEELDKSNAEKVNEVITPIETVTKENKNDDIMDLDEMMQEMEDD